MRSKKNQAQGNSSQPPSFYEADLQKWTQGKFSKANEDRRLYKAILTKQKQDLTNITTKNLNLTNLIDIKDGLASTSTASKVFTQPKRRMSRQSNNNFSNVDFNYVGDTGTVSYCYFL
jgi:hypothetical protein